MKARIEIVSPFPPEITFAYWRSLTSFSGGNRSSVVVLCPAIMLSYGQRSGDQSSGKKTEYSFELP
jgi:hypothetical protein